MFDERGGRTRKLGLLGIAGPSKFRLYTAHQSCSELGYITVELSPAWGPGDGYCGLPRASAVVCFFLSDQKQLMGMKHDRVERPYS